MWIYTSKLNKPKYSKMKNRITLNRFLKYSYYIVSICTMLLSIYSFKDNNLNEYSVDLTGYLGKYPITMHLNIVEEDNGDVQYIGYYVYNRIGKKIKLKGSWLMRPGTRTYMNLTEFVNNSETGEFELLPNNYGEYKTINGSWFGNGKTLKVNLRKIE
jgi:hypothetical protein